MAQLEKQHPVQKEWGKKCLFSYIESNVNNNFPVCEEYFEDCIMNSSVSDLSSINYYLRSKMTFQGKQGIKH